MTEESANAVCRMDVELCDIVKSLRLKYPNDKYLKLDFSMKHCVLENYADQVIDPSTTSSCIKTNKAFMHHKIPYTPIGDNKIIPTLNHKFFITDLPYGLVTFKDIANSLSVQTPLIDEMIMWNQKLVGKEYCGRVGGRVTVGGRDVGECVAPNFMGIKEGDIDE